MLAEYIDLASEPSLKKLKQIWVKGPTRRVVRIRPQWIESLCFWNPIWIANTTSWKQKKISPVGTTKSQNYCFSLIIVWLMQSTNITERNWPKMRTVSYSTISYLDLLLAENAMNGYPATAITIRTSMNQNYPILRIILLLKIIGTYLIKFHSITDSPI
jgi:hypothetical protein